MNIAQTIRTEIERAEKNGVTRYRITQDLKGQVSEAQLSRLVNGKTLTAETLEILLDYFGYKLVKTTKGKRG